MKNKEVAELLYKIAEMLSMTDGNRFKIRAYENAGQAIDSLPEPIEDAINKDEKIPGIGDSIKEKVVEYLTTGELEYYNELKKKLPEGLLQIIEIPGMGPKKAKLIFDKLGISTVDSLQKAAKEGKLRVLPGLGEKTEQNILQGIEFKEKSKGRVLLNVAFDLAENIMVELKKYNEVDQICPAGSLRRKKETIGDIDILCTVTKGKEEFLIDKFINLPIVNQILSKGRTKSSIVTKDGMQVDLRVLDSLQYGAALQYFTGSKEHNIELRELAIKKGYTINEYGIFKLTDKTKPVAAKTEEEIYRVLKLEYIPPELREGRGEIDAAKQNKLPDLVQLKDIKGDMHVHSNYSDGHNTIQEMAEKAVGLGYEWIIICDHSQSLKVAHGLSVNDIYRKIDEIKNLNKKSRIKILAGTEIDILSDGSLDYPDNILKELDFVICAIHTGFKQSEQQITDRVKRAFENKYVHSMSHPSGRLLTMRSPYQIDMNKLLEYAKTYEVALEINGRPERLDLSDIYCKKAKENGIKFTTGTDAHNLWDMDYMKFGIYTAQRGWLEKNDIINTLSYDELNKFLSNRR